MSFQPTEHYRFIFKEGMSGWDIEAAQIALNSAGVLPQLVTDGVFGPRTKGVVEQVQRSLGITIDGIAGPQTQSLLSARECTRAEPHVTPAGLLKGICLGESGGFWAATSSRYPDGSRDYGPLQDNLGSDASETVIKEAFRVRLQAREVGQARRSAHDFFLGQAGAKTQEAAWRLSVLSYNLPAAANQIAAGRGDTWIYTESGTGAKRHLSDVAPWVQAYHIPGVNTGFDWCDYYVATKVAYVKTWEVT